MTEAAYALFCDRGYAGTTMADIAQAAGVAVQTVYFTFHTKRALLSEAYSHAVQGPGDPLSPEEQPWYAQMVAAPNVTQALRPMVVGVGEMLRRATPLDTIMRGDHDPDIARVRALHERLRAKGYSDLLEILRAKSDLRTGLRRDRATQLLLLYVGMDVYRPLVSDFGWTHDEWVDWTVMTLKEQLFSGGRAAVLPRGPAVPH